MQVKLKNYVKYHQLSRLIKIQVRESCIQILVLKILKRLQVNKIAQFNQIKVVLQKQQFLNFNNLNIMKKLTILMNK